MQKLLLRTAFALAAAVAVLPSSVSPPTARTFPMAWPWTTGVPFRAIQEG